MIPPWRTPVELVKGMSPSNNNAMRSNVTNDADLQLLFRLEAVTMS